MLTEAQCAYRGIVTRLETGHPEQTHREARLVGNGKQRSCPSRGRP